MAEWWWCSCKSMMAFLGVTLVVLALTLVQISVEPSESSVSATLLASLPAGSIPSESTNALDGPLYQSGNDPLEDRGTTSAQKDEGDASEGRSLEGDEEEETGQGGEGLGSGEQAKSMDSEARVNQPTGTAKDDVGALDPAGSDEVDAASKLTGGGGYGLGQAPLGRDPSCSESVDSGNCEKVAKSCRPTLKVYMYDLPRKFNFGLFRKDALEHPDANLPWNLTTVPRWPGGEKKVRHQHSTAYYMAADLIVKPEDRAQGTIAERVRDPAQADIFFVPFFASFSHNKFSKHSSHADGDEPEAENDKKLQTELLQILNESAWWQRSEGRDHVIPASHPQALRYARRQLAKAIFILVDFERYGRATARLSKDVVSPYNHLTPKYEEDTEADGVDPYSRRPTLLFFQGTIKRKKEGCVRQELASLLKDEPDVHFEDLKPKTDNFDSASHGMRSSKFCLHPAGDTPSSCRLFDAVMSLCVPVVVSDHLDLPFEDVIDYRQFTLFVAHRDAVRKGHLATLLRSFDKQRWLAMWRKLREVQHFFEFQTPALRDGAVDMIWHQVYNKLPTVRLAINRSKRIVVPDWWDDAAQMDSNQIYSNQTRRRRDTSNQMDAGSKPSFETKMSKEQDDD